MKWRSTALVQGLHNNAVMGNLQGQRGKVFQGHCIARNIARAALELRHAPLGTRCSAELVRSYGQPSETRLKTQDSRLGTSFVASIESTNT